MKKLLVILILGVLLAARTDAAQPPIGKAVEVGPTVTAAGDAGERKVEANSDIFFLDKISTNPAGVGEFLFSDG